MRRASLTILLISFATSRWLRRSCTPPWGVHGLAFILESNVGFPRAQRHWCRFFKPARMGDFLEVTIWIGRPDAALHGVLLRGEAREGETDLVARANYSVVCVDRHKFTPIPVPEELVALLGDYLPPVTERLDPITEGRPAEKGSKGT